jgi:hypothetical protein
MEYASRNKAVHACMLRGCKCWCFKACHAYVGAWHACVGLHQLHAEGRIRPGGTASGKEAAGSCLELRYTCSA